MRVPLEISVKDVNKTPALMSLVEEKAARLDKLCNDLISCRVAISVPHSHPSRGSGYHVSVEARVPPNQRLVSDEHSSQGALHDNVDTVVRRAFNAVERQLKAFVRERREGPRKTPAEEGPGMVVVVDKEKRYGIIKTVAGRDVYFTENAVLNDDFDRIEVGTTVRYEDEPGDEGPRATTVQIIEKKGPPMVPPSP